MNPRDSIIIAGLRHLIPADAATTILDTKEAAIVGKTTVGNLAVLRNYGKGPKFFRNGVKVLYTKLAVLEWLLSGEGNRGARPAPRVSKSKKRASR